MALYHRHRPQTFAELVGQDHVCTTLLNELKNNAVSHAYLFSGPRGIGKTSSARLLARAINCLDLQEGEPDNTCAHCTMILEGKALDVVEIDAASNTGVDNVRENIIENARVAPSQLKWKVFIIDEVHMLSTSAFNALLKTLEEPPSKTLFILATTELHKVPATIISRCERFQLRKISFETMRDRLKDLANKEGVQVDAEVIDAIVKRSEGALRDAESLLGQVLALDESHVTAELAEIVVPRSDISEILGLWEEMLNGQASEAITRIHALSEQGVMLGEFTKDMIEFLRKVLLYVVQQSLKPLEYLDVDADTLTSIQKLSENLSSQQIAKMIEVFLKAQEQLKSAMIIQLPLELAIIELTSSSPAPAPVAAHPSAPAPSVAPAPVEEVKKKPEEQLVGEMKVDSAEPISEAVFEKKNIGDSNTPLTLDDVLAKWSELLKELKAQNHALHLTFKVGKVVSFKEKTLTMGYEYQFYQDRLNDAHNHPVIDKVFMNVFNQQILLETVVGSEYAPSDHDPNIENVEQPTDAEVANVWDLASKSFGTD